ncbi:hypothetical protein GQ44DRAFT_740012 [Phaeosphaeriaceae sp. PMI808]|nr:hypothetical protein GQ44DRAFT_740012 [Phaeosphaeriaceae sp. PMI808]
MCIYWKKRHTCGHISIRPYIEMCRTGCLSNTVCSDIGDDAVPRSSYFACWMCIKNEARAEIEADKRIQLEAIRNAEAARDTAIREKLAIEQRAKEGRIRREAREKANKEREEEAKLKATKDKEEERARKEGGLWIETGSGKKQKGRKTVSPALPLSAPPFAKTFSAQEKIEDMGGRAGFWGPKKILSRKENSMIKK